MQTERNNYGEQNKMNVIYIMGAGRSGTTALNTFLGENDKTIALAEIISFFEHLAENKNSGDGYSLLDSPFWKKVLDHVPEYFITDAASIHQENRKVEHHPAIIKHLLGLISHDKIEKYINIQEQLFEAIFKAHPYVRIVDSSKYIGRALSLRHSKKINLKVLYNVRDVRGVIWSFKKKVQTTRQPIRTVGYYSVINYLAEIAYRTQLRSIAMKIRYEDVVNKPRETFSKIGAFIQADLEDIILKIEHNQPFNIGPIIEGNRLKKKKAITLRKDSEWQKRLSGAEKWTYFFLTAPLMLINRYKVRGI